MSIDLRSVKGSIILDFEGCAVSHESWVIDAFMMFSNGVYDAFEMVSWKSYKTSSIKRFPLIDCKSTVPKFILSL